MKRFIILFLTTILLLTLAACGSPQPLKTDFYTLFSAQSDDTVYAGSLNKSSDHLTVTMSEPYPIAGMVFDYSDNGLSIKSSGLSTNADADYLPDSSVPGALRNALLYLSQARYIDSENGKESYSVTTPYGEALLTANDGYPTEITEPHSGIIFKFTAPSEAREG